MAARPASRSRPTLLPPATNGNNVDTGTQLVDAQEETLQYQTMVEMLNAQFRLISGAAGGSFS